MKKLLTKRLIAGVLCLVMILSLTACGDASDKTKEEATNLSYGEVWSAPSSIKVMQDEEVENKGGATLSFQAVRNEYESCQLFITAKKDVKAFVLEKADLKNGDAVLEAENIEVYWQKYGYYNDTTVGSGYAPDALIPMANAAEHKENAVKTGENGGFWVTIYVPKDIEVGVYEGTFALTADGDKGKETLEIPVSVEVFDYTLTDEVNAETLFSWRYQKAGSGELDGSIEMMTTYYEFFLDYRISLQSLPVETLAGSEMVEKVLKYWDRISSYTVGTPVGSLGYNLHEKPEMIEDQILSLAAASNTDKNLLDKAIMYPIDEPNWTVEATRKNIVHILTTITEYLENCISIIKADKSGAYTEFKKIKNWEKSILDIPMVIPNGIDQTKWIIENENTPEGQELLQAMNCYCPQFDAGNSELFADWFRLAEKYDIELWWYGCVGSRPPLPTYFVGDDILNSRTVSWMQKKYDIVGNLYWDTAGYTTNEWTVNEGYNAELFDYYHIGGSGYTGMLQSGDGYLCYPGVTYGVYGPLPSIRMMSIRDGMEEYELLLSVESALKEKESSLGEDFSVEETMEMLFYKSLYYLDLYMYRDGEKGLDFTSLRASLLQFAAGFEKGLVFIPLHTEIMGTNGTLTYYVAEGMTVSADGEEQQPISGQKYETKINLEETKSITLTVSNAEGMSYEYITYIGEPKYTLNELSKEAVLAGIETSEGSSVSFVSSDKYSTDGTSIKVNVKGVWTDNDLKNATFVPAVSIQSSILENKIADLEELSIDVYNAGADFNVVVRFYSGTSYVDVSTTTIKSGKNTLTVAISDLQFEKLDKVDRIAFEFQNAKDLSCEFYLDNIAGKK